MNSARSASTSKGRICSTKAILKMASARQKRRLRAERNSNSDMNRAIIAALASALCATGADLPRRIVSLSPNVTEMLYGVGALDQVVGISDYCTYPPDVNRLPSVGGWHNPNLEKIAALRPDLVIADDGQAPFVEA